MATKTDAGTGCCAQGTLGAAAPRSAPRATAARRGKRRCTARGRDAPARPTCRISRPPDPMRAFEQRDSAFRLPPSAVDGARRARRASLGRAARPTSLVGPLKGARSQRLCPAPRSSANARTPADVRPAHAVRVSARRVSHARRCRPLLLLNGSLTCRRLRRSQEPARRNALPLSRRQVTVFVASARGASTRCVARRVRRCEARQGSCLRRRPPPRAHLPLLPHARGARASARVARVSNAQ